MASTEQVMKAAGDLGKLIAKHNASMKFQDITGKLRDDTDAQRLMTDYSRQLQLVHEKENKGQPIEVTDKHKVEDLQNRVIQHPVLRDLQMAQMDYMDLLRQVDEAIQGPKAPADTSMPTPDQSPVVNPDLGA